MNMVNTTPFEGTISLREHHSTSNKTSFEAISSFQEIRPSWTKRACICFGSEWKKDVVFGHVYLTSYPQCKVHHQCFAFLGAFSLSISCYLHRSQLCTLKSSLQDHKPRCQLWASLCRSVGGGRNQVALAWCGHCSAACGCEDSALWGLWLDHS